MRSTSAFWLAIPCQLPLPSAIEAYVNEIVSEERSDKQVPKFRW